MSLLCSCGRIFDNTTSRAVWVTCIDCGARHELPPCLEPNEFQGGEQAASMRIVEPSARHREHWKQLHRFAFTATEQQWQQASEWYAEWLSNVPNAGCSCRSEWSKIESALPPDFSSREAFFAWTVEAHNRVNERLGKPVLSLHNARLLHDMHYALTQPERLPKASSTLAVVSIASGSHLSTLAQTWGLRRAYAERVGADAIDLTDDRWPDYPMANKWRLGNVFAAGYERVLYVDSDVVIKPDAPNIFEAVPADAVGLVDEFPTVRANGIVQENYAKEFAYVASEAGWQMPQWCPNGGVMVLPAKWACVYEPPRVMPDNRWCLDQYLLAVDCEKHGAKVELMDGRWNWGWIDRRFWKGLSAAWMVHLNGSGSGEYRRELLSRIIAGNYEPLKPPAGMWAAFFVDSRGDICE